MTIGVPTFGAVARALGPVTPVAPAFSAGKGVIVFTGEHYGTDSITAPGVPWVELSANVNSNLRAFAIISATGAEAMPTFNWGATNPGWAVAAVVDGLDPGLLAGFTPGDRQVNSTVSIFGPASSKTPSVNGCINFLFGAKNKTSASNTTVFTPPSGFTLGLSDIPSGGASAAVAIAYQIQTAATTLASGQTITGSVADAAVQTSAACLFSLQPLTSTPLAATPSASASATGTLTSVGPSGAAAASTAASASLTTAIKAAVAASAGTTLGAALTNWTTVTLGGTQYTGTGGIHDPALVAQGFDPPVGATISYDATNATVYANGEISSITNNCSFVAQYFDGTTWRTAVIVITPQIVSYATITAAAAGALTTSIQMASAAVSLTTSTGALSSAIRLAGSALSIANAAASLLTGVQLAAQAPVASSATGALSGGQASLQGAATALTSALGQLTAKIQLAAQVSANSVVTGALATKIVFDSAATALTQAAAQITVGIQLAGNAVVAASLTGSTLIVTNFAGAANAVANATGALLAGLRVAGDALASSSGSGDLSTGISLAGAAEADTIATLRPVGAEGKFGYAQINVLSPTGLPVDLAVFIEGSASIVQISYFNLQGAPFVPNRVDYSVIDVQSGTVIIPYTTLSEPDLANAITIPGDKNSMVSYSKSSEQHRILFKIVDNVGTVNYASAIFEIEAVGGVLH